jgi:transmembrane sensor
MTEQRIEQEAVGWLARQHDDAMDWDGFTAWLEADPRHRETFDAVALLDSDLDRHAATIFPLEQDNEPQPAPGKFRWAAWSGGGAIAAALALVFFVQRPEPAARPTQFATVAGETKQLRLADGTRIALAPASSLSVADNRLALAGTAYFDVPHRDGRTLTITAGDFVISDVGTRFAVSNDSDQVRVDMTDGVVMVRSAKLATPIRLTAGRSMIATNATGSVSLGSVLPDEVAGWRSGELRFDHAPLAVVVRELSRYSGAKVSVDPAIAERQFSGVITIRNGTSPARSLAQIMALNARPVDGGVRLESRAR